MPGSPVPRPAAAVGYGDDLNGPICNPIDYHVGKPTKEILPRAVRVHRPSFPDHSGFD
jgi:hypothetical protein